jgi:histidine triad (HIT) family protein
MHGAAPVEQGSFGSILEEARMAAEAECIFCKIIEGKIPSFRIYEDDGTVAFMDINPANPGHALVVPREHARDLYASSEEALAAAVITAKKVATAVQMIVKPDGLNVVQCNGPGAKQSVFHLHVHVVPRREGDELKMNWGLKPGNMDEIKALAEKIKASLAGQ